MDEAARDEAARRYDPRGLIREAYRIEGIDAQACRSIFFDWALGLAAGEDPAAAARALHTLFGAERPDHPMTALLAEAAREGLGGPGRRRGGWRRTRRGGQG